MVYQDKNNTVPVTDQEIDIIASMHIKASVGARELRTPSTKFHFFRDKIKLFHRFDPDSIILMKNEAGEISGILIFTYDEKAFNKFAGPATLNFYFRLIKTLAGFYGFDYLKFLTSARSTIGLGSKPGFTLKDAYGKIWVLLVMEEFRNRGIASELIKKCIEKMKARNTGKLIVTVKTDNLPAIRTYEKCGFIKVGTCQESSGPSDIMQLDLT